MKSKNGFTIIEVVLTLAIAGLIFLMVFVALPTLQRNQRDTQRKRDLSMIMSKLTTFRANNKGRLPTATSDECNRPAESRRAACYANFVDNYLAIEELNDPSTGEPYTFTLWDGDKSFNHVRSVLERSAPGTYNYSLNTGCDGDQLLGENGMSSRGWHWTAGRPTLWMKLESGFYCIEEG